MNLDASCLPGVNSRCLIVCQVYNQKIKPKCNGIRLVNVGSPVVDTHTGPTRRWENGSLPRRGNSRILTAKAIRNEADEGWAARTPHCSYSARRAQADVVEKTETVIPESTFWCDTVARIP